MIRDIETVEAIEKVWSDIPKNVIGEKRITTNKMSVLFACEIETYKIILSLAFTKRSLREEIFVLDSSKKITVDKLIVCVSNSGYGSHFLPLVEIRDISQKENTPILEICKKYLQKQIDKIKKDPKDFIFKISRIKEFRELSNSVSTISGGRPGSNRKH